MRLADLRRTTIKKHLRIRFRLPNGMECLVDEHGIAQIPALRTVPDFNLEEQLGQIREFLVEPVGPAEKKKPGARLLSPEQLAALAGTPGSNAGQHREHDE